MVRDAQAVSRFGSQSDPVAVRVQSLLEDRFQLRVHRETKELPIYELIVAKTGLKMKLSEDQTPFQLPERADEPAPRQQRNLLKLARGTMQASGVEVWRLVRTLSQLLGRTVVDKTGLEGLYDFSLRWTPDPPPIVPGIQETAPAIDPNGPSIFTALQEQLGLRLVASKGPVEVLVIDNVQKPTEN